MYIMLYIKQEISTVIEVGTDNQTETNNIISLNIG